MREGSWGDGQLGPWFSVEGADAPLTSFTIDFWGVHIVRLAAS